MLTIKLTASKTSDFLLLSPITVQLYWLSLSDRSTSAQSGVSDWVQLKALSWSNNTNLAEFVLQFHSIQVFRILTSRGSNILDLERYPSLFGLNFGLYPYPKATLVPSGVATTIGSLSNGIHLGIIVRRLQQKRSIHVHQVDWNPLSWISVAESIEVVALYSKYLSSELVSLRSFSFIRQEFVSIVSDSFWPKT